MDQDLKNLIALQAIDKEIIRYKHTIDKLKTQLEESYAELKDDKQIMEVKHQELMLYKQQRMDLNLDWETSKLDLEKLKKMSLQVKTNKEYQDILKDIDHKKNEIDEMIEDILLQDEKIEKVEQEYKELEKELQKQKALVEESEKKLQELIAVNNRKIEAMNRKAQKFKNEIPKRLLRRYERIKDSAHSGGIALVAIQKDGTCGGCHGTLPLQKVVNLKESGSFMTCEMCGRLIYYSV